MSRVCRCVTGDATAGLPFAFKYFFGPQESGHRLGFGNASIAYPCQRVGHRNMQDFQKFIIVALVTDWSARAQDTTRCARWRNRCTDAVSSDGAILALVAALLAQFAFRGVQRIFARIDLARRQLDKMAVSADTDTVVPARWYVRRAMAMIIDAPGCTDVFAHRFLAIRQAHRIGHHVQQLAVKYRLRG